MYREIVTDTNSAQTRDSQRRSARTRECMVDCPDLSVTLLMSSQTKLKSQVRWFRRFCPAVVLSAAMLLIMGCERTEPIQWSSSQAVTELPDESLQDELVEMILRNGGNPTQRGPKGDDPLEYVLNSDRFNLLKPFLDAGANPSPMYNENESWVSHFIRTGDREAAYALVKAGASLGDGVASDGDSIADRPE